MPSPAGLPLRALCDLRVLCVKTLSFHALPQFLPQLSALFPAFLLTTHYSLLTPFLTNRLNARRMPLFFAPTPFFSSPYAVTLPVSRLRLRMCTHKLTIDKI